MAQRKLQKLSQQTRRHTLRRGGIPPFRGHFRLKTVLDVRRLFARLINAVLRGDIPEKTANAVGFLAGQMLRTFELEVDARLAHLEEALEDMEKEQSDESS
jgi:hypothetical protein